MGVDLGGLVPKKVVEFEDLPKTSVAIDGYNALYQFLSVIRQPDGSPLVNERGEVTSHLQGLFNRTTRLLEHGITPIYVFDGRIIPLKEKELKARKERRELADKEAKIALAAGDLRRAYTKAIQSTSLSRVMAEQAKKLLRLLGVATVDAPYEGEAQAAKIVIDGKAEFCASQDYDSLLFGAPRLIRNLTLAGRRRLPYGKGFVEVKPELILLSDVLSELGLTRLQLIEIGVLLGTDYNAGFKGIGPKTAYNLIKQKGGLNAALAAKGLRADYDLEAILAEFLNPRVSGDYDVTHGKLDREAVIQMLCEENGFSLERVTASLNRLERVFKSANNQPSLEKWF